LPTDCVFNGSGLVHCLTRSTSRKPVLFFVLHQKGAFMYAQLWHTGAMSHTDFFGGALPMSSSAVNPEQESVTPSGRKPTVTPRPMSKEKFARP